VRDVRVERCADGGGCRNSVQRGVPGSSPCRWGMAIAGDGLGERRANHERGGLVWPDVGIRPGKALDRQRTQGRNDGLCAVGAEPWMALWV